jgi:hypothetical protein
MLRHVVLVTTDVSEEPSASIIWVTIGKLGKLAVTSNRHMLLSICSQLADCHSDNGSDTFLWNVGSYKSHMA